MPGKVDLRPKRIWECWRRSQRGHACLLICQLDPGNQRLLTPSFDFGMFVPPTIPIAKAVSRIRPWESNVLLRPSELNMRLNPSLYRHLRFWQASVEVYLSCGHPRKASHVSSLAYRTYHLPMCNGLPFSSVTPFLLSLRVRGPPCEPTERTKE